MQPRYTFDYLLEVLQQAELIPTADVEALAGQESAQRYRLETSRGIEPGRRNLDEVGPAELLASFEVSLPDGDPLSEDRIMAALAKAEGLPYLKIDPLRLDAALITSTLSWPFARRHRLLPLGRKGKTLRLATDDPFNLEALESVRTMVTDDLEIVLSARSDILRHIREVYGFRRTLAAAAADLGQTTDLGNLEQLVHLKSLDEIEATDQHIVNAVEYLLHYAFDQSASDIHVEPKREEALVRLRIDGVLHTVKRVPPVVHMAMVSRIKTMARLDIAEKRRPQDGRIKTHNEDADVELRVSTMPTAFGEKLVVRIFDPTVLLQDLGHLGFTGEQQATFESFVGRPHGLVLVTGPTGSGKTTTLYSALQMLATDRVNVATIEDPIEMVVEEFNQTAVSPRAGLTFATALRTLLRQDPDVIMVGEIRDKETADHAIQAALTGHLVLSTLHTNDSAGAITRLSDLGIEPFLIASTLVGTVAQRLVRRVCEACRVRTVLSRQQALALGIVTDEDDEVELPVRTGKGCPACRHTGLRGRNAIFEVLPITDRIQRLIVAGEPSPVILEAAKQDGMQTLRQSGIDKLARGLTSFEEVLRVTSI